LNDQTHIANLVKRHFRDVDDFFSRKIGIEQLVSVFKEDAIRTRGNVSCVGLDSIKQSFLKQRDEVLSMKHKMKRLAVVVKDTDASATLEWTVALKRKDGKSRRYSGFDTFEFNKVDSNWKIAKILIMAHGGYLGFR